MSAWDKRRKVKRFFYLLCLLLSIICVVILLFGVSNKMPLTTVSASNPTATEYNPSSESDFLFRIQNECAIITGYLGSSKEVALPITNRGSLVVGIDDQAFMNTPIESITFPSNIIWIGERAFSGCADLNCVTFSEGLQAIEACAFENCKALRQVQLPYSTTWLGDKAFWGCTNLSTIYIHSSMLSKGKNTKPETAEFIDYKQGPLYKYRIITLWGKNGVSLTRYLGEDSIVIVPSSIGGYPVIQIGEGCFRGSSLSEVTLPQSVMSIDDAAFSDCSSLQRISMPGVEQIGKAAFSGCTLLNSIDLPQTLCTLDEECFKACTALGRVILPKKIKMLPSSAFADCTAIHEITLNSSLTTIGNAAFMNCSALTVIQLPSSLTAIASNAFANCAALRSIRIPESVSRIGSYAFDNCSKLKDIVFSSLCCDFGDGAFCGCAALVSISLPDTNGVIPMRCFERCSSLKQIKLPVSTKKVEAYAFADCPRLTAAVLPDTVQDISKDTFFRTDLYHAAVRDQQEYALKYLSSYAKDGFDWSKVFKKNNSDYTEALLSAFCIIAAVQNADGPRFTKQLSEKGKLDLCDKLGVNLDDLPQAITKALKPYKGEMCVHKTHNYKYTDDYFKFSFEYSDNALFTITVVYEDKFWRVDEVRDGGLK